MIAEDTRFINTGEAGKRCGTSADTVSDWMLRGILVQGTRVKLQFRRVGGRKKTTAGWLEDFIAACNGNNEPVLPEGLGQEAERLRAGQEQLACKLRSKK